MAEVKLQPNKISSLNKADQDQRRQLQKIVQAGGRLYSNKNKKEGHEAWMKILDVKEELKELLASHTSCPRSNRPKPPKPPPPKPRPKGLQPAKPAKGQGPQVKEGSRAHCAQYKNSLKRQRKKKKKRKRLKMSKRKQKWSLTRLNLHLTETKKEVVR